MGAIFRPGISAVVLIATATAGWTVAPDRALAQAMLPTPKQSAYIGGEKDFEDMSRQERDAAKAAAREKKWDLLRVCADPGNMPFSDTSQEGFENKIAE